MLGWKKADSYFADGGLYILIMLIAFSMAISI